MIAGYHFLVLEERIVRSAISIRRDGLYDICRRTQSPQLDLQPTRRFSDRKVKNVGAEFSGHGSYGLMRSVNLSQAIFSISSMAVWHSASGVFLDRTSIARKIVALSLSRAQITEEIQNAPGSGCSDPGNSGELICCKVGSALLSPVRPSGEPWLACLREAARKVGMGAN